MTWNPVFNFIISVKNQYIEKFNNFDPVEFTGFKNIVEKMVSELDNDFYKKIIQPLQINQWRTFVLLRYGRFSDIYGGENDITPANFWNIHNGFYRECRSVVIDIEANKLVITPFKKFHNINEGEENSIDKIKERIKNAKSVEFADKIDGSMQCARYYNGKIVMAGSQAINPENSWRLEEGYEIIYNNENYQKAIKHFSTKTLIFEFVNLKDQPVVRYDKSEEGLYLIGIRDIETGIQHSYEDVKNHAAMFNLKFAGIKNKTFTEIQEEIKICSSDKKEGYVVNVDGFLFKMKCDDYVKMHRILSELSSPNLVLEHIRDNTFDDFMARVPEAYVDRVEEIARNIFKYIRIYDQKTREYYYSLKNYNNKKEFMLLVEESVPKEFAHYVKNVYLYIVEDRYKCKNDFLRNKKYGDILAKLNNYETRELI